MSKRKLAVAYIKQTGQITRVFTCTEANAEERKKPNESVILVDRESGITDLNYHVENGQIVQNAEIITKKRRGKP